MHMTIPCRHFCTYLHVFLGRRDRCLHRSLASFFPSREEERYDALEAILDSHLRVLPLSGLDDEIQLTVSLDVLGRLEFGEVQ